MTEPIHLTARDVPPQLKGGYTGRHFKVEIGARVSLPLDAGLSDGGTREQFTLVRLANGAPVRITVHDRDLVDWQRLPPHANRAAGTPEIEVPAGCVLVRHSWFCGKDTGLTFFVRPENVAALLPRQDRVLNPEEQVVLRVTAHYKPAYRLDEAARAGVDGARFAVAKAALIEARLLTAAGAITASGRNALQPRKAGLAPTGQ